MCNNRDSSLYGSSCSFIKYQTVSYSKRALFFSLSRRCLALLCDEGIQAKGLLNNDGMCVLIPLSSFILTGIWGIVTPKKEYVVVRISDMRRCLGASQTLATSSPTTS